MHKMAAVDMHSTSREMIKLLVRQRLQSKDKEVYQQNKRILDESLSCDYEELDYYKEFYYKKYTSVVKENLTTEEVRKILQVGKLCAHFNEKEVASCLRESFYLLFSNGRLYWERIFISIELIGSIISAEPKHVKLIERLADHFQSTRIGFNQETVNQKVLASGSWVALIFVRETGSLRVLKAKKRKEGSDIVGVVPPHKPVSKICVCNTPTGENTSKKHQCKTCGVCLCMFPGCDFTSKNRAGVYRHYYSVHETESSTQFLDVNTTDKIIKKKCKCGKTIPFSDKKVIRCRTCKMYLCMFKDCDVSRASHRGVSNHQLSEHRNDNFFINNPLLYCVCKQPKHRDLGLEYMKCPNSECNYTWCLIENCEKIFGTTRAFYHHRKLHHSTNQQAITKCANCKKRNKIRDNKTISGKCDNCGIFWCLIGNCIGEYVKEFSLRRHHALTHDV